MDEVHAKTVDLGLELREAVEARFAGPPIIVLGPVAADLVDPPERNTLAPVVDQLGFDGDTKRNGVGAHNPHSSRARRVRPIPCKGPPAPEIPILLQSFS